MLRLLRWLVFFVCVWLFLVNLHEAAQVFSGLFLDPAYVLTLVRDRTFPRTPDAQDRNIAERPLFLRDEWDAAKLIFSPLLRAQLLEERADFRREQAERDERQYEDALRP